MAKRTVKTAPAKVTVDEDAIRKKFGAKVATARARLGWTRKQLAEKAQVSESYIGQIENGAAKSVRPATLRRVEEALKQTPPVAQTTEVSDDLDLSPLLKLIAACDVSMTYGELRKLVDIWVAGSSHGYDLTPEQVCAVLGRMRRKDA